MVCDRERFTFLKNERKQFKTKVYKIFKNKKLNYQRRKTSEFSILT